MNVLKKITVWLLAISMLVTPSTITAYAVDNEDISNINEGDVNTESQISDVEEEVINQTSETGEEADNNNENGVTEKQKAFEYIYIDEQTINIPEEQNIMVAFADTELKLESVIVICKNSSIFCAAT